MGNTNTIHVSPPVTVSPAITANPVLNVHQNSNPNFVPNPEQKEQKTDDFLREQFHKSSRIVPGQKDAADRAGGSSSVRVPPKESWNDMDDDDDAMYDAYADGVSIHDLARSQNTNKSLVPVASSTVAPTTQPHNVFDRVPTPPHPILETTSTVPYFPNTSPQNESDEANLDMNGKPVDGSFDQKTIIIRVDLRSRSSPFFGFGLSRSNSNNLTSLRRVLFKASELKKVKFSPNEMFAGMQKGKVQMTWLSNEEMAKLKEQIKTAEAEAAAAAQNGSGLVGLSPLVSSVASSPPIPALWSHKFKLTFDTALNTKAAYASLSDMLLSPILVSPRWITGICYGFNFDAPKPEVGTHLQQHAWHEKGAPSLQVSFSMQPGMQMYGCTQRRDGCYFKVLATEFNYCLTIPSLRSSRPLTFHVYTRSKTVVCYHCNQVGHKGSACAAKERTNAAGQRDACIMCGSFDHISSTCPARDDPNATCIICKKGKHTVRACPLYRGSYKIITPRQSTGTAAAYKRKAWGSGKTVDMVSQQQQQQQGGVQQPPHVQEHKHAHNTAKSSEHKQRDIQIAQQGKMIQALLEQNTELQKTVNALTQQITILSQLMSAHMSQTNTNTNAEVMQNDASVPAAVAAAVTTKATNKSKDTAATKSVNKAQHDVTSGTPRLNNFFTPLDKQQTQDKSDGTQEHDTDTNGMDPASAFNALLSTTHPTPAPNKKHKRVRTESTNEDEGDMPAAPTSSTITTTPAATTSSASASNKTNTAKGKGNK